MKNDSQPGLVVAIGDRPPGKEGDGNLEAASSAQNVDTVPLDSLAMPDDQEQMQPPEVGDEVNYQVTGKVVAIEGNVAKVQRTSINGQEVPGQDDEADDASADQAAQQQEGQGLRDQAGGMGMMMSVILFLSLLLAPSARAQNSTVTTSPQGAYYSGADPLYGLPYYSTHLQSGMTFYVLQAASDVVYSDSTNGTDALTGPGMFTPLNTLIYEVTSTNRVGQSVTNVFYTADKSYYGSFYGNSVGVQQTNGITAATATNIAAAQAAALRQIFNYNNYFVAPKSAGGSDTNDGSTNAPWWSLTNAFARAIPPASVYLLPGTNYCLCSNVVGKPITFVPPFISLIGRKDAWLCYTDQSGQVPILSPLSYANIKDVNLYSTNLVSGSVSGQHSIGIYAVSLGSGCTNDAVGWSITGCTTIGANGFHFEGGQLTNVSGTISGNTVISRYQGIFLGMPNLAVVNNNFIVTNPMPATGQLANGSFGIIVNGNTSNSYVMGGTVTYQGNGTTNACAIGPKASPDTNCPIEDVLIVELPQPNANCVDVWNWGTSGQMGMVRNSVHRSDGNRLTERAGGVSAIVPGPLSAPSNLNSPGFLLSSNAWSLANASFGIVPGDNLLTQSNGVPVFVNVTPTATNVYNITTSGGGIIP